MVLYCLIFISIQISVWLGPCSSDPSGGDTSGDMQWPLYSPKSPVSQGTPINGLIMSLLPQTLGHHHWASVPVSAIWFCYDFAFAILWFINLCVHQFFSISSYSTVLCFLCIDTLKNDRKNRRWMPLVYTHNTCILSLYIVSSWLSVGKCWQMRINWE